MSQATAMIKTGFVERRGKLEDLDRAFDRAFWQAQSPAGPRRRGWTLRGHWLSTLSKSRGKIFVNSDLIE